MSLPGAIVDLPSITDKDEIDLVEFGIKNRVHMVAASFIRKAEDVEDVRNLLDDGDYGKTIKIFAKVENREAISNYEEIVRAADGIIIQRVALSQEIPPEKVFIAQKYMIEKANLASKPVVIFGNVIQSMTKKNKPTRAEATEISVAVLDGVDCLMVGEETAVGEFPVETVSMMSKICAEAERCVDYKKSLAYVKQYTRSPTMLEALASNATTQVLDMGIDLIIVLTETGVMPQILAKYRPSVPIFAVSTNELVVWQLNALRGVTSYKIAEYSNFETLCMLAVNQAKHLKLCKPGRKVLFIHGNDEERPDVDPRLKLIDIYE